MQQNQIKNNGLKPASGNETTNVKPEVKRATGNENRILFEKLSQLKSKIKETIQTDESIDSIAAKTQNKKSSSMTLGCITLRKSSKSTESLTPSKIEQIRQNIIGFNTRYISPFNMELQTVYADHTATNRPYATVERMIQYAKKFSANPHTEFSHFGKFSTQMMHYAHDSLLRSFSASDEDYVALPTGSGSTGAIEKTIKILKSIEKSHPNVYLTPYEHHSNILPWVQYYDRVNVLASDAEGNLLMNEIEEQLLKSQGNVIVTVSAASNVTSKITNLKELNEVIKKVRKAKSLKGQQIIFSVDCAAYCPHHELNLKQFTEIDFAHLSPHKNLGGAESCGVLIARKSIVKNAKPTFPGGGTVAFVKGYSKEDVMYDVDIFNRQIAGTPPFLGFYRAALSFQLLKNSITYEFIHKRQKENTQLFMKMIAEANKMFKQKSLDKKIVIYGDQDFDKRANVITLNILNNGKLVQHSFLSLILSDVFGIQIRSGCFCAGPFGMQLLNLDAETTAAIQEEVSVGIMHRKPGYLRLDLTFYMEPYEIQYLAQAIIGVAEHSRNMELVYTICNDGEIQRHKLFKNFKFDMYSLCNSSKAEQMVREEDRMNEEKLEKRQKTLEKQLKRGLDIVRCPVQFLKNQQCCCK